MNPELIVICLQNKEYQDGQKFIIQFSLRLGKNTSFSVLNPEMY